LRGGTALAMCQGMNHVAALSTSATHAKAAHPQKPQPPAPPRQAFEMTDTLRLAVELGEIAVDLGEKRKGTKAEFAKIRRLLQEIRCGR